MRLHERGRGIALLQGLEVSAAMQNDLDRDVYCVLGLPIDAVDMTGAVTRLKAAARQEKPYLLSTPNVNFLMNTQSDAAFRSTLLESDLCLADGMPIVWLAKLLGIPLPGRIAGSDLIEALKQPGNMGDKPVSVFFFGGAPGVAQQACERLNTHGQGLVCVGSRGPGFGSVEELSQDDHLRDINASGAEFLIVALGAHKGQAWLSRNRDRLQIPVRSHLGAVINFEAGVIVRAPVLWRKTGLEWLWRIKQEPALWRRYWSDGWALTGLLFTRVLPLAIWTWLQKGKTHSSMEIAREINVDRVKITLSGFPATQDTSKVRTEFRAAVKHNKPVILDISSLKGVTPAFLGAILMLSKTLSSQKYDLQLVGFSIGMKRLFKWNGLEWLVKQEKP